MPSTASSPSLVSKSGLSESPLQAPSPASSPPSLRERRSANFLAAFEADFQTHGVSVIEKLRENSPEKYAELGAKLIAASEPEPEGFESCQSMEEVGRKLLQSVGVDEFAITDGMIEAAIALQDRFTDELSRIARGN